jgi:hypothetical protein
MWKSQWLISRVAMFLRVRARREQLSRRELRPPTSASPPEALNVTAIIKDCTCSRSLNKIVLMRITLDMNVPTVGQMADMAFHSGAVSFNSCYSLAINSDPIFSSDDSIGYLPLD